MIGKLISGLSAGERKVLIITLVVVIIALFDRMLIDPTVSRLAGVDEEISREKESIKQDLHFLTYKDSIVKESKSFEQYIAQETLSDEEIIASFLKKLEGLANQANVNLIKVTPVAGQPQDEYIKYQADLECSGQFVDVISFMHTVNTSKDLLKVVRFNLGAKRAETQDIKATMTISRMYITKNSSQHAKASKEATGTNDNANNSSE